MLKKTSKSVTYANFITRNKPNFGYVIVDLNAVI